MSWSRRLLNLVRSNRHSRDLDRELAFHIGERVDDLVAGGMPRADAEREARRRFGNYGAQKEQARDADVFAWLDVLIDDVRYAIRALRHSPGFATVAILSLALGIGANTAIFTLIDAVMLRSLPVSHPEELLQVKLVEAGAYFTNPLWEALRDRQQVFSGVFAYSSHNQFNLAAGGETRYTTGSLVSGDFFSTLGVQPQLGRLLSAADDQRGCAPIAVLSDAFWHTEYGADPAVLGKSISLNSHPFRVVGVSQPGFVGLEVGKSMQVFVPICADLVLHGAGNALDRRSNWWLSVIGRPKPGLSPDRVAAGVKLISAAAFGATVPPDWRPEEQRDYQSRWFEVASAANGLSDLRHQYRTTLFTLMAIVALVLLIACANVANLLMARATVRRREFAIRVALGAGRGRLIRQLLTESVLLSLVGSAVGLLFARWGCRLLVTFLSPTRNPIFLELGVDRAVLAFNVGVATLTGLAFGLAPAWRSARVHPNAALKANARGVVEGQRRFTAGKALVVVQIAVSLTLVVGAGLLVETFRTLSRLDPGFHANSVLLANVTRSGESSSAQRLASNAELLRRLRALPGVTSASLSQITPLGNSSWNEEMIVDGYSPKSEEDGVAWFNEVSDGYFRTLGSALLSGRDFNDGDRVGTAKVAVINESMARRFYGTASNPIGKTYRTRVGKAVSDPVEIIGVVSDAKYLSLREQPSPTVFVPIAQDSAVGGSVTAEVQTSSGPTTVIPAVKATLAEVNPTMSVTFVPFAAQIDDSLKRERLLATLSAFFGGLALLLSMLGLYGVMAYNVARRRNEIGIRMALGAGQRRVAGMVLREVALVLCLGLVAGLGLALATTRLISTFLFGLGATDVMTFGGSMGLLAAVGLLAAYLPARRASRVDPMEALREE